MSSDNMSYSGVNMGTCHIYVIDIPRLLLLTTMHSLYRYNNRYNNQ